MNTKQLFCALACQKVTGKYFDGIFARDTLTDIESSPGLLICNTDFSTQKGEHWILFHFINHHCRFYDPLGMDFSHYGDEFSTFVNRWSTSYEICNVRTQPLNTDLCGIYCLYFAYYSCSGKSSRAIVNNMFKSHSVINTVKRLFYICPNSTCKLLQCCVRK